MGVPTTIKREGEVYSSTFKMYTSGGDNNLRIQWHRFEKGCHLHPIIQTKTHVAFKIASIDKEHVDKRVAFTRGWR